MSWSGPVAGAPYQPPPQAHGQPGFGQPPAYQYGQHPAQQQHQPAVYSNPGIPPRGLDNRPPKKKGNPIITKYPPPPGYQGPAQHQGPYGTSPYPTPYQQYPPAQQGYTAPSPSAAYPNQGYPGYGPPIQTHAQVGYQQAATHQWPQQTPSAYPNGQYYGPPQASCASYPTPITPTQASGWQQTSASYPSIGPLNSYGASGIPTPISAHPSTAQHTPISAQPPSASHELSPAEEGPLNLAVYDWDFDFDGAIWPKASEPVDPNFSLGQIVWHPASQVTRALPSSFTDAEAQAEQPPAEKLGNGESVSVYFTAENSHEAFLDVRQTDEWEKISHDPAFVVFTDEQLGEYISVADCVAMRDRPDDPPEDLDREGDTKMQKDESSWDVMGGLERALSGAAEIQKNTANQQDSDRNANEHRSADQVQEDILAKLGVTGRPKTPTNEVVSLPHRFDAKPPASLPPRPPVAPPSKMFSRPEPTPGRAHSYGGHRSASYGVPVPRPYGSVSSAKPSPSVARRSESQGWKPTKSYPNGNAFDGARDSPMFSEGNSNPERSNNSAPQLDRSDSSFSRKRSYDDADQDDQRARQHPDHAKRKRRSEVDAVYSRR